MQLVACRKNKLIENIESTQKQYKAKWHESCRLQYNKTKLRQPEKRKKEVDNFDDMEAASMVFTCKFSKCTSSVESCFFCGKLESTGKP